MSSDNRLQLDPVDNEDAEELEPTTPISPRLLERSSSLVRGDGQPEVSHPADSTTNATDSYDWAVRVVSPPADAIPRNIFSESCLPTIRHCLGRNSRGDSLTWPDRGWNSGREFEKEVASGLASTGGTFCIARAQTKAEAEELLTSLLATDIPAEIFQVFELAFRFFSRVA